MLLVSGLRAYGFAHQWAKWETAAIHRREKAILEMEGRNEERGREEKGKRRFHILGGECITRVPVCQAWPAYGLHLSSLFV